MSSEFKIDDTTLQATDTQEIINENSTIEIFEKNSQISCDNNIVQIFGTITTKIKFSHEVFSEKFYSFTLEVPRLSDFCDKIPITISEKLMKDVALDIGNKLKIKGQFRSYNNFTNKGNKLILSVFVKSIDKVGLEIHNLNFIYLNGYVCKMPVYRTTPFGREITDLLLAVNRIHNKSDYVPCIAWGRNAKYAQSLKVGTNVKVWGRLQSREYQKKINDQENETRVAYEVSLSKIDAF